MISKQNKGNPEEWEGIWHSYKEAASTRDKRQLFVRGKPRTLLQFWQQCYFEDLQRLLPGKIPETSFLELGSGRGTLSMYLSTAGATDLTMVDLSETGFELARRNFAQENMPLPKLVLANAEHTGLPAESCDCVTSLGLLEHFEDPSPTIRESFRLIRPGGFTYQVIVPAAQFKKSILCMLLFKPLSLVKHILLPNRVEARSDEDEKMIRTEIDRDAYLRIAQEAGFVDCACIPYNPYWNVNREGWFQDHITLWWYAAHHALKRFLSGPRKPLLKTSPAFELCYLLTGRKP